MDALGFYHLIEAGTELGVTVMEHVTTLTQSARGVVDGSNVMT
jgi:hypothetical protein